MAISSHSNSQSVQPRFTIKDLDSANYLVTALDKSGCRMVPKSQLESMTMEPRYFESDMYMPPMYWPMTLYSIETAFEPDFPAIETKIFISNMDGILLEVGMLNDSISEITKLDIRRGFERLQPNDLVEFLDSYVKYYVPQDESNRHKLQWIF